MRTLEYHLYPSGKQFQLSAVSETLTETFLATTFSKILDKNGSVDIGPQFMGKAGSKFVNMGCIVAFVK